MSAPTPTSTTARRCMYTTPHEQRVPALLLEERQSVYGPQVRVRVDGREFWTVKARITGATRPPVPVDGKNRGLSGWGVVGQTRRGG